jgi:hypothetical protein
MKLTITIIALAVMATATVVLAEPQTRVYDARGNSIGTAVPLGNGSVRYFDARGNSMGTSTTTGGTTRFYDAGGRPAGSTVGPAGPRSRGAR